MMRVTVEVHPGGDASRKKIVATFDIGNESDLAAVSNYSVFGKTDRLGVFRTHVKAHTRALGWAPLVKRILDLIMEAER